MGLDKLDEHKDSLDRRRETAFALTPRELLRWMWRQLTSMRTALILLFMLALGAVPGSVVPQEAVDAVRTANWQQAHPHLAPIYGKLGLFSVYNSVWFSAIYILLMISLVGCILPRTKVYWQGLRAKPPQAPKNLSRLRQHREFETDDDAQAALTKAHDVLRSKRYRVVVSTDDGSVAAERGYLREFGNLLFHSSVLLVLAGFAIGGLFGYKGGVIVVTGGGFSNTLSQYDDFQPGGLFSPANLAPFDFTVDNFDVTFIQSGREAGMAHEFSAGLSYHTEPGTPTKKTRISVNHPLTVDNTKVYLLSHGYAPHITIRDGKGQIAYAGPVIFLPEDATFRSTGVVKAPDASPTQIGLEGEFFPTYAFTAASGPFSAFPDDKNPAISMTVWTGNLGLDTGAPQSVYSLDKSGLKELKASGGRPYLVNLSMGHTQKLPNGLGSVTFDGISRYVKLQVSRSPGDLLALAGVSLALLGLIGSLYIRPRRVWVRVRREGGRTLVEVAGLDRSSGGNLAGEIDVLTQALTNDRHPVTGTQ
ncbi:MAG: ResB family protein [Marmoricola sp.]|jgi:cytochrome c biogenesis protein|nr:ResB family protein [Marmoricola sp.]